ncbi:uncharacterized protein Scgbeta [Venturia canescens]|uniref:uncharacterized protein Scgbeta n=1 Tax=Venturia canescens TaxID=32260 RepID=UPI001C9C39C1|nr:uncharacterized protein LOC122406079 [Venturia canescens]XP_043267230.1 uncharacterized protein LOC122406079 [Venturia canescens]XP_043267231.1 uncharacterized protein LOC122406079 [Venturia canescens]
MASFLNTCNVTGSPSMSKTEDNLSNSEGPLLKRNLGQNHITVSSENVRRSGGITPKNPSRMSCQDDTTSMCESSKKRYCLWALTLLLGIVGLCNLLLSITIISVLRVSHGMEAMEVIPEADLVKFYGRTDLDKVFVQESICQGYGDEPVELIGDDSSVLLSVRNRRHNNPKGRFSVQPNGTTFSMVESFEVKDSRTGDSLFSTNFPNFGLPSGVGKLAVNLAETHRVVSPVNSSLTFESNRQITIHGAESTTMESKAIVWMADNNVYIKSNHGIVLNGKKGIFLDVAKMPVTRTSYQLNNDETTAQYKICVCMPQGKLFRVPVAPGSNLRVNCARIATSPELDPCQ